MMNQKRLEAFGDMLKVILFQYDATVGQIATLKDEGKEKSVPYRQPFASKRQLQAMLSYYRAYDLIEDEEQQEHKFANSI